MMRDLRKQSEEMRYVDGRRKEREVRIDGFPLGEKRVKDLLKTNTTTSFPQKNVKLAKRRRQSSIL